MVNAKSMGFKGLYQKMKPITDKNIGKKIRHQDDAPMPNKQTGAAARRLRQQAAIEAKRAVE